MIFLAKYGLFIPKIIAQALYSTQTLQLQQIPTTSFQKLQSSTSARPQQLSLQQLVYIFLNHFIFNLTATDQLITTPKTTTLLAKPMDLFPIVLVLPRNPTTLPQIIKIPKIILKIPTINIPPTTKIPTIKALTIKIPTINILTTKIPTIKVRIKFMVIIIRNMSTNNIKGGAERRKNIKNIRVLRVQVLVLVLVVVIVVVIIRVRKVSSRIQKIGRRMLVIFIYYY